VIGVLVVDDDYRVADLHKSFVERCPGFAVVGTALSASEARRIHADIRPDLVLLDLYLPDGHGLALAGELRAVHPADIMVITAAKDVANIRAALHIGALNYLVKPFAFATLRDRLERYASWRNEVGALRQDAHQNQIDGLFGRVQVEAMTDLPKGLNATTLQLVERTLRDSPAPLSAEDVAHLTGVSRVTARRYLQFLVDRDVASIESVYGAPGRPRHLYGSRI
jgi:response regulator of citrate/malate metabolism